MYNLCGLDFMRSCADRSGFDIEVPRERFKCRASESPSRYLGVIHQAVCAMVLFISNALNNTTYDQAKQNIKIFKPNVV